MSLDFNKLAAPVSVVAMSLLSRLCYVFTSVGIFIPVLSQVPSNILGGGAIFPRKKNMPRGCVSSIFIPVIGAGVGAHDGPFPDTQMDPPIPLDPISYGLVF